MNNKTAERQVHNRTKSRISMVITILFLLGFSLSTFFIYRSVVNATMMDKTKDDLKNSVKQADMIMSNLFSSEVERLKTIAIIYGNTEEPSQLQWNLLKKKANSNSITYIVDDGGRVYKDGEVVSDVLNQRFFQNVMTGHATIERYEKAGKNSIVVAYPIYRNNEIEGAVCTEYQEEWLFSMMNIFQKKNGNTTYIMKKDGTVFVGDWQTMPYENLFELIPEKKDHIQSVMNHKFAGSFNYQVGKSEVQVYFQKTSIRDWHVMSSIPKGQYSQALKNIEKQAYIIIIINCVIYVCVLLTIFLLVRTYKKDAQDAKRDVLTGACNRDLAKTLMSSQLKWFGRTRRHACLYMDLDYFKKINDTFGHQEGDNALKKVVSILRESVRKGDVVSRFGGDEFCIWIKNIENEEKLMEIVDYIFYRVRKETKFTISMGIALFPVNGMHYEELVKKADEALYMAKKGGRDQYYFYNRKKEEV